MVDTCSTCPSYANGECHYGPPIFDNGVARWPGVDATDWCRAWGTLAAVKGANSCATCPSYVNNECHYGPPVFDRGVAAWPSVEAANWCSRFDLEDRQVPVQVTSGVDPPDNANGNNGDIYILVVAAFISVMYVKQNGTWNALW